MATWTANANAIAIASANERVNGTAIWTLTGNASVTSISSPTWSEIAIFCWTLAKMRATRRVILPRRFLLPNLWMEFWIYCQTSFQHIHSEN